MKKGKKLNQKEKEKGINSKTLGTKSESIGRNIEPSPGSCEDARDGERIYRAERRPSSAMKTPQRIEERSPRMPAPPFKVVDTPPKRLVIDDDELLATPLDEENTPPAIFNPATSTPVRGDGARRVS